MSALLSTSGLPDVLQPVGTLDPGRRSAGSSRADSLVVSKSRPSVVGRSGRGHLPPEKVLEGTGFVIALNRVMSNAHQSSRVGQRDGEAEGKEVRRDIRSPRPNADISILDVPNLPQQPLVFADEPARPAPTPWCWGILVVWRFRRLGMGPRDHRAERPDIYKTTTVNREVYTIRGFVRQGIRAVR